MFQVRHQQVLLDQEVHKEARELKDLKVQQGLKVHKEVLLVAKELKVHKDLVEDRVLKVEEALKGLKVTKAHKGSLVLQVLQTLDLKKTLSF